MSTNSINSTSNLNIHIGKVYRNWEVLSYSHRKRTHYYFNCKCSCGAFKTVDLGHLKRGNSKACRSCRKTPNTIHGQYKHKLYYVWQNMIQRCSNPNNKKYRLYGAAGIKVCDEWLNFKGFRQDMANSYKPGLSLDRIDSNGNYNLNNCRWTTALVQALNRPNAKGYTYNSKNGKFIAQIGINYKNVFLGYYDTAEEARAVYEAKRLELLEAALLKASVVVA